MVDLSTDPRLVSQFAQKIGEALSSEVTPDIIQYLIGEEQARALARVIFEMIHEHEQRK